MFSFINFESALRGKPRFMCHQDSSSGRSGEEVVKLQHTVSKYALS